MAWIVGIYDLGGCLFFLLSLLFFFYNRILSSALFYLVACLFKEAAIVLPLILLANTIIQAESRAFKSATAALIRLWPYFVIMVTVASVKIFGQPTLRLPPNNPYYISVENMHNNYLTYLLWMLQSFQFWHKPTEAEGLLFIMVMLSVLAIVRHRFSVEQRKIVAFLIAWACIALIPPATLPNHVYRYYATYSLPAFIALVLILVRCVVLSVTTKMKYSDIAVVLMSIIWLISSIVQSGKLYAEGLNARTITDGTNLLVKRAAIVDIVKRKLDEEGFNPQKESVLIFCGLDVSGAFHKNDGLRFLYKTNSLSMYEFNQLKVDGSQVYVENGTVPAKRIDIDVAKAVMYEFNHGELTRRGIDLPCP
jgi:hypothetical protein